MALRTAVDVCNRALQEIGSEPISALTDSDSRALACNRIFNRVRDELLTDYPWGFSIIRRRVTQNSNDRHSLIQSSGGWTLSAIGTGNYYLPASNAKSFKSKPDAVYGNDVALTENTSFAAGLSASQWGWGDNDSLGYPALYVRLSDDTDPDTKYAADNDYLEGEYNAPEFGFAYAYPITGDCLYFLDIDAGNSAISVVPETNISPSYIAGEPEWEMEQDRLLTNESDVYYRYVQQVTAVHNFDPLFDKALSFKLAEELCGTLINNDNVQAKMNMKFSEAIDKAKARNAIVSNFRREKTLSSSRASTPLQRIGR